MTHFTQDLLSKAKFGEFSVYHHCFDPGTPEDVMGASVEQPWPAQGHLGRTRAVAVADFHTIIAGENFWRASPFQKPNPSPKPAVPVRLWNVYIPR